MAWKYAATPFIHGSHCMYVNCGVAACTLAPVVGNALRELSTWARRRPVNRGSARKLWKVVENKEVSESTWTEHAWELDYEMDGVTVSRLGGSTGTVTTCFGIFHADKTADVQALLERWTAPCLAQALRERENLLHMCAAIMHEHDDVGLCSELACVTPEADPAMERIKEVLSPFSPGEVLTRRRGGTGEGFAAPLA